MLLTHAASVLLNIVIAYCAHHIHTAQKITLLPAISTLTLVMNLDPGELLLKYGI